ncbi:MAG: SpoIIE family protein phosphatase [Eubacterium sp.]|nr:SpoIIE family protein phosphatase [Eubacterium sp.]
MSVDYEVNEKMEVQTQTGKLSVKFMTVLFCMGLLIYAGVLIVGRGLYERSIKEYYDMMAYDAAEIAADYFGEDRLAEYSALAMDYAEGKVGEEELAKVTEDAEYKRILNLMRDLRENMDANDVFVCTVDMDVMNAYTDASYEDKTWTPLVYIADCYEVPEDNFLLGDKGMILSEFREAVSNSFTSGKRYEEFYLADGGFGYNLTAMLPIVKDGKTVAFIGVEIPMRTLDDNLTKFVVRISLITGIVVLFNMLVASVLFYKIVIAPIKLSASEARAFVDNNTQVSEKLKTIKTGDEIQVLSESLLHMEIGINEYIDNVKRLAKEKERIGAELNIATEIQADMLPSTFPAFPDRTEFDLYATMDPAKEVGGDFYDFFLIDENHIGLVMADVSGKGVPAALFMVIAKTLIKNRALMGGTPSEVLAYANEQLCEGNGAELFVTVWFAIIDLTTGKGLAANAGHEHPVLRRAGGQYELVVYKHSPAVATMEGLRFREHEFELHPGDRIFVYTDGVAEATNARNELFGTERMLEALNKNADATPQELLPAVRKAIDRFVGAFPQFDDITMLAFDFKGKQDGGDNTPSA